MSAVVITPTTGMDTLAKAIQSVATQDAEHWIVVDGSNFAEKAIQIVKANAHPKLKLILLPENTGNPYRFYDEKPEQPFFGHRIYAAMAYLINSDYVFFLDEDNWYEPNHVDSLVKGIKDGNLEWAYSLRKIVDEQGSFVCEDNCDSLGIFPNQNNIPFVDMNCYCFTTKFLLKLTQTLYRADYNTDRQVFKKAVELCADHSRYGSSGKYTVNYRSWREGQTAWFLNGNMKMHDLYKTFPWRVE